MSRIDLHTATAFLKLRSPDLSPILDHLRVLQAEAMETMARTSHEDVWRTMQGRVAVVRELIELAEDGEMLAAKLAKR